MTRLGAQGKYHTATMHPHVVMSRQSCNLVSRLTQALTTLILTTLLHTSLAMPKLFVPSGCLHSKIKRHLSALLNRLPLHQGMYSLQDNSTQYCYRAACCADASRRNHALYMTCGWTTTRCVRMQHRGSTCFFSDEIAQCLALICVVVSAARK